MMMIWPAVLVAAIFPSCTSAQLTVSTPPSLVQCQPVMVSWQGGTAPYILAVIRGGQPSAAALEIVASDLPSSPYTWIVDIAAGTSVTLKVTDGTGAIQYSSPITIQYSNDASCLGVENGGASLPPPPPSSSSAPSTLSSSSSEQLMVSSSIHSQSESPPPHTITDIGTSTRSTSTIKISSTPVNPPSGSVVRQGTSGYAAPRATRLSGVVAGGLGLVGGLALLI